MGNYTEIQRRFIQIIGAEDKCLSKPTYQKIFDELDAKIGSTNLSVEDAKLLVIKIIIDKLQVYYPIYKNLIDTCAKALHYYNYPEKKQITSFINGGQISKLQDFLKQSGVESDIIQKVTNYHQYTSEEIIDLLQKQLSVDPQASSIVESIYSAYIYSHFQEDKIHKLYTRHPSSDFYQYLKDAFPSKYNRENALTILYIDQNLYSKAKSYDDFISSICAFLSAQYQKLQNYCYLAIHIKPIYLEGIAIHWKLYSDIVLFAEKFIEEDLHIGYFHPDKIREITSDYIAELDVNEAKFNLCNTGYSYKDCFIIADEGININDPDPTIDYSILILFQKNERDEDIIPCPTCRSNDVRGNSYPIIGVKSWECHNPICPDKSKYNRGKRYSMASIIKQEAIENPLNEIDKISLSEWRLDVVPYKSEYEIAEFIIKQYSFYKDNIYVFNAPFDNLQIAGRILHQNHFDYEPNIKFLEFYKSCYFERFAKERISKGKSTCTDILNKPHHKVYNGDCESILSNFPEGFFAGAVTSPPYYNAREYSHWANIYCYLYDMYNHARQIYRTLKAGGYYLYNIFDYFDNENNVVFSDMGKRRMILGAYIIYLFQKAGFKIQQNIIWYKGHIQGHRNTNQGNNSPYYQAPLNCYEHILCFRKDGEEMQVKDFPHIINVFPVVKIIKGHNILGHTAPYPLGIPDVLCRRLKEGDIIVDPYSGSFTSARCAEQNNLDSVSIEISKEYCELGIKLLTEEIEKNKLFKE